MTRTHEARRAGVSTQLRAEAADRPSGLLELQPFATPPRHGAATLRAATEMSTHDTDPQRSSLFAGSGDKTEPGPPPETAGTAPEGETDAQLAAALLADLAKAPLPTDGVRETEGHSAAAVALAAHRPPRATDDGALEPAVLLNTTDPLPRPAPMLIGVPVPPIGLQESKGLEVRRSAVQYSTVPSARVHRRQTAAIVIVVAVAALAAAAIVAFVPSGATLPPEPAALTTPPAVSIAALAPGLPASVTAATAARPAAAISATPAPVVASGQTPAVPATARAPAIAATASAPRPASSAPHAPRSPSGSFEEPDRNF